MDVRVMALIPTLASGIDSGAVELSTHALFEVLAGRFFEASKIVLYDLLLRLARVPTRQLLRFTSSLSRVSV
jgi:hypothetical protein